MRTNSIIKTTATYLAAVVVLAVCAATTVRAAAPALQGQVTLCPLTPTEMNTYALTSAQGASGLTTGQSVLFNLRRKGH